MNHVERLREKSAYWRHLAGRLEKEYGTNGPMASRAAHWRRAADELDEVIADVELDANATYQTLEAIRLAADAGLAFGRGHMTHPEDVMIRRRDERLRQIVKLCADAGIGLQCAQARRQA